MAQTQQHQGGGRDGGDRRTAEERRISIAINSFQRDYHSTQETRQESDEKHIKWNRRAAKAAIGYTVFTACLLALAVYASIQTWNAIDASNRAADAATSQARTSDDAEKRSLRAYVGVTPGDVKNYGTPEQYVTMIRKNYGQTPAYDVGVISVGANIILDASPIPSGTGCSHPNFKDLLTMFPSMPVPLKLNIWNPYFTSDSIKAVAANQALAGGYVFIYYGTICYDDAFGKPHYTNFCYMYRGKGMTADDANACFGRNDSN